MKKLLFCSLIIISTLITSCITKNSEGTAGGVISGSVPGKNP